MTCRAHLVPQLASKSSPIKMRYPDIQSGVDCGKIRWVRITEATETQYYYLVCDSLLDWLLEKHLTMLSIIFTSVLILDKTII